MLSATMRAALFLSVIASAVAAISVPGFAQTTQPATQPTTQPATQPAEPVAVVGGTIITVSGAPVENGVMLVENGKVTAVGSRDDVPLPDGITTLDATGKIVMPGLVDTHSHIGGPGGGDRSGPIQPDVRVYDSLDPYEPGFKRALAGGVTTLNVMPGSGHLMSGQTVYLKNRTGAKTIEDLLLYRDDGTIAGGMKMANGTNPQGSPPFPGTRGKAAALIRQHFINAQEYKAKMEKGGDDPTTQPGRDIGMEAMIEVLDGKRIVHHHTHRADDIMTVLRLQEEFGFRVVLHHVSEASVVADEIAKAGVPASIILVDSPGGKLEARNLLFENAPAMEKAGALTAFHTDDPIVDSRHFMRMAAFGVRAGMSRDEALKALTINGAQMLDLGGRVGTLEAGKDADFVILSGDPLSTYTVVEQTWVEGRKAFDRSDEKDRLYATGGYGAGYRGKPYFCCFDHEHAMQGY